MNSPHPRTGQCLVTGASGYIGNRLCERFDAKGVQPYVPLVRKREIAEAFRNRGRQPALADLLNTGQVKAALRGCESVIHLANGDQACLATRRLVECAIEAGIQKFIHISTMSVHGPAPGPEAGREETARIGRYNHDYSDAKAEEEELVQNAHDRGDLQVVILRPTIVFGLGGHFEMLVLRQARKGVVQLFDQGTGVCNAVYVDDVCDAIEAALHRPQAIGQAMFVNADQSVPWGEFIRTFASMVEPPPRFVDRTSADALQYWAAHPPAQATGLLDRIGLKLKRMTGWRPPVAPWPPLGHVQRETLRVTFSNEKAKRLLEWSPKVDFKRGAELTQAWLQAHGHLA